MVEQDGDRRQDDHQDHGADMSYSPTGKKPGRPSKEELEAREAATSTQEPSPRVAETRRARRRRADTSATAGLKLHVPEQYKDPNFEYRWMNDSATLGDEGQEMGQRMHEKTVLDDWEPVMSKGQIDGKGEGTPVKRLVGRGEAGRPVYGYLCRKPKDWYDADKAGEQAKIDAQEEQMRRAEKAEGLAGPTAYVPEGGIKIRHGN